MEPLRDMQAECTHQVLSNASELHNWINGHQLARNRPNTPPPPLFWLIKWIPKSKSERQWDTIPVLYSCACVHFYMHLLQGRPSKKNPNKRYTKRKNTLKCIFWLIYVTTLLINLVFYAHRNKKWEFILWNRIFVVKNYSIIFISKIENYELPW